MMGDLTVSERTFYAWYHFNGKSSIAVESQREIFLAGWEAATAFIAAAMPDDPPELDPADAEAQLIAETCADATAEMQAPK